MILIFLLILRFLFIRELRYMYLVNRIIVIDNIMVIRLVMWLLPIIGITTEISSNLTILNNWHSVPTATKKAPFQVLFLYLKVVAAVVIGGLVLPVEVDKVVEDGALGVV